jgi:hypothetical protein
MVLTRVYAARLGLVRAKPATDSTQPKASSIDRGCGSSGGAGRALVNCPDDGLVIVNPVGVLHSALAQIFHFLGDQAVAEAALSSPHLNHDASPVTVMVSPRTAAVRD